MSSKDQRRRRARQHAERQAVRRQQQLAQARRRRRAIGAATLAAVVVVAVVGLALWLPRIGDDDTGPLSPGSPSTGLSPGSPSTGPTTRTLNAPPAVSGTPTFTPERSALRTPATRTTAGGTDEASEEPAR